MACEEPPDFGPSPGGATLPSTTMITLSDNVFDESSIIIEWEGNEFARIFEYKLKYLNVPEGLVDPHSWTEWDTTRGTSIDYSHLDEGAYKFYINAKYNSTIFVEDSLLFSINAIPGPALRIYPLNQTANPGDEIDVYLYLEDIPVASPVLGFSMDIQINSNEFEFIPSSYELNNSWLSGFTNETPVFMDNYNGDNIMTIIGGVVSQSGMYNTGYPFTFSLTVSDNVPDGTFEIKIANEIIEGLESTYNGFQASRNGSVTVEEVEQ